MKKNVLSYMIDYLLLEFVLFFICFVWARYTIKNHLISILVSVFISFILTILALKINNIKQQKNNNKRKKQAHIEDCANFFLFNNFEENATFFQKILENKYKIDKKNNFLYLTNDIHKIALFLLYDVKKVNQDQVVFCLKSVKKYDLTKIIILCNSYENNVVNITEHFNIKTNILNIQQTYSDILCIYNTFPNITQNIKIEEKISIKFLIKNAINKKKFKTYFFGGLFLFIASIFVRYNIYYIIFSSIMFILSILCLFSNKIYKQSKTQVL